MKEEKTTNWADRLRRWEEEAEAPLPPQGDWQRLARKLPPPPPRRRLAFVWFGWGAVTLVAVATLVAWLAWKPEDVVKNQSSATSSSNNMERKTSSALAATDTTTVVKQVALIDSASTLNTEAILSPLWGKTVSLLPSRPSNLEVQLRGEPKKPALPTSTSDEDAAALLAAFSTYPRAANLPNVNTTTFGGVPSSTSMAAMGSMAALPLLPFGVESKPLILPFFQPTSFEPVALPKKQPWQLAIGPTMLLVSNRESPANTVNSLQPVSSNGRQSPPLGLQATLSLGSAWQLQLGYLQAWEHRSSQYRFQRNYTLGGEQTTSDGRAINSFEVEIAGKYAKTAAEIEVSRTNLPTSFQTRLLMEASLVEEVTIRKLPMALTYDLPIHTKWALRFGAGALWQQNQIQIEQQTRLLEAERFELRRTRVQRRELTARESIWMGQVLAGVHFQPSAQWSLTAQVNLLTNLGQVADTENVNYQGPAAQLTAQYHFGKK